MGEETIAVELTESEICEVKIWADLVHLLANTGLHGPEPWNAPNRIIEMKMLKALDAIHAKKAETAK